MSATHRDCKRSAVWILLVAVGVILVAGCGTPPPGGKEPEKPAVGQPDGTKELDKEYWQVEKLRLDRMVFAECHSRMKGDSARILFGDVESLHAKLIKDEGAFVLKHKVDIKQFRDEFNRRHPLTEMVYKEPLPISLEVVSEMILETTGKNVTTDEKVAAVETAAKTKLRDRPTYKALAAELE